jgi:hypothetical protein
MLVCDIVSLRSVEWQCMKDSTIDRRLPESNSETGPEEWETEDREREERKMSRTLVKRHCKKWLNRNQRGRRAI